MIYISIITAFIEDKLNKNALPLTVLYQIV